MCLAPVCCFVFGVVMPSVVDTLCAGLAKEHIDRMTSAHQVFLAESNGSFRVKVNLPLNKHLDSQCPDCLMPVEDVQTFAEAVDGYFLKKISGPTVKNKVQHLEWARVQAKKGKKLVRAHRRNLGKVQAPETKLKPDARTYKIAAKASKQKVKAKVKLESQHITHNLLKTIHNVGIMKIDISIKTKIKGE